MAANLFNTSDNSNSSYQNSGEHPDKVRFEQELLDVIPTLVSLIEQAHYTMLDETNGRHPDYLNHLSRSVRMHEQIKGSVMETFGSAVRKLKYNRFGLFMENFVILFKKLDSYGRPSNIKTNNTAKLLLDGKLNFPGEPIVVHVGYVLGNGWEEINKIYAVGISDNQVDWISNLRSFGTGLSGIVPPVVTPVDNPDDGLSVAPKNSLKKANTGS